MSLGVELRANRAHAAVHHVGRRDGVRAGFGVRDRGLGEQLERDVVVDLTVIPDHAAVTVRHVLAKADIGDHREVGLSPLEGAHRELHDPLRIVCA